MLGCLIDRDGPAASLEETVRRFLLFVARDLRRGVAQVSNVASQFSDAVVIVDPANPANNVAARVTPAERDGLIAAAKKAYETITWAQGLPRKGETLDAWQEIFGDFSIE